MDAQILKDLFLSLMADLTPSYITVGLNELITKQCNKHKRKVLLKECFSKSKLRNSLKKKIQDYFDTEPEEVFNCILVGDSIKAERLLSIPIQDEQQKGEISHEDQKCIKELVNSIYIEMQREYSEAERMIIALLEDLCQNQSQLLQLGKEISEKIKKGETLSQNEIEVKEQVISMLTDIKERLQVYHDLKRRFPNGAQYALDDISFQSPEDNLDQMIIDGLDKHLLHIVIYGMHGVGKTTLMKHIYHMIYTNKILPRYDHVLWLEYDANWSDTIKKHSAYLSENCLVFVDNVKNGFDISSLQNADYIVSSCYNIGNSKYEIKTNITQAKKIIENVLIGRGINVTNADEPEIQNIAAFAKGHQYLSKLFANRAATMILNNQGTLKSFVNQLGSMRETELKAENTNSYNVDDDTILGNISYSASSSAEISPIPSYL